MDNLSVGLGRFGSVWVGSGRVGFRRFGSVFVGLGRFSWVGGGTRNGILTLCINGNLPNPFFN